MESFVSDCLFCKIISREIPGSIVYEDDRVLAFNDINPQAPTHVLIVPKRHIASLNELTPDDDRHRRRAGEARGGDREGARHRGGRVSDRVQHQPRRRADGLPHPSASARRPADGVAAGVGDGVTSRLGSRRPRPSTQSAIRSTGTTAAGELFRAGMCAGPNDAAGRRACPRRARPRCPDGRCRPPSARSTGSTPQLLQRRREDARVRLHEAVIGRRDRRRQSGPRSSKCDWNDARQRWEFEISPMPQCPPPRAPGAPAALRRTARSADRRPTPA